MKASFQNREKTKIGYQFLLFVLVNCLLFMSGCSSKTAVTYIPTEEPEISYTTQDCKEEKEEKKDPDIELSQVNKATLMEHFSLWKGTRYRYGGVSRKGVDCSGFTMLTYKKLFGKNLPRTVHEQGQKGQKIPRSSLQPGDLVFFKTGSVQKHVGIYLENDCFMHASRSHGVIISKLNESYWKNRFWKAKRIEPLTLQDNLYGLVPDKL